MAQYKCLNCNYDGDELVYQFNDYTYCIASNDEAPEYVDGCPDWVKDKGDAEIGEPVGCLKCRVWGVNNFERIE